MLSSTVLVCCLTDGGLSGVHLPCASRNIISQGAYLGHGHTTVGLSQMDRDTRWCGVLLAPHAHPVLDQLMSCVRVRRGHSPHSCTHAVKDVLRNVTSSTVCTSCFVMSRTLEGTLESKRALVVTRVHASRVEREAVSGGVEMGRLPRGIQLTCDRTGNRGLFDTVHRNSTLHWKECFCSSELLNTVPLDLRNISNRFLCNILGRSVTSCVWLVVFLWGGKAEAQKERELQAWLAIKKRYRGLTLGMAVRVSGRMLTAMVYEFPDQPGNLK